VKRANDGAKRLFWVRDAFSERVASPICHEPHQILAIIEIGARCVPVEYWRDVRARDGNAWKAQELAVALAEAAMANTK